MVWDHGPFAGEAAREAVAVFRSQATADYPGFTRRHPGLVAGILYRDFRRERDDATVIVARHSL
jgi:hypothetical protein